MPPKRKADNDATQRSRLSRWRRRGKFHSKMLTYPRNSQTLPNLLWKCSNIVWTCYAKDDLKAPQNNGPKPAMLSKPSVNVYFGTNVSDNGNSFTRTAYGVGSGVSSIGLNPKTMTINAIFPELSEVVEIVSNRVKKEQGMADILTKSPFNFVSVKIYFTFLNMKDELVTKDTGWHVDVTTGRDGKPCRNNSQKPGTPVAILTCGDRKNLWFRRFRTKQIYDDGTKLLFPQENGSLFLLDARDEIKDETGWSWQHMSDMSESHGVTFSFMLRCVQKDVEVKKETATLVNPKRGGIKEGQFKRQRKVFESDKYKKSRNKIDATMAEFFKRTDPNK